MFQQMIPDMLARRHRVRFRSWKDGVLFIVVLLLWAIADAALNKIAPNMDKTTRSRIVTIICIVVLFVGIFLVGN